MDASQGSVIFHQTKLCFKKKTGSVAMVLANSGLFKQKGKMPKRQWLNSHVNYYKYWTGMNVLFTLCWASQSGLRLLPDQIRSADMAFQGTWQVYLQENYEEFLRAIREFLRPIYQSLWNDQGCISQKHWFPQAADNARDAVGQFPVTIFIKYKEV